MRKNKLFNSVKLDSFQENIIIGSLIGKSGEFQNFKSGLWYFSINHSYFDLVYFNYKKLLLGKVVEKLSFEGTFDISKKLSLNTKTSKDYDYLVNPFYKRKRDGTRSFSIPSDIENYFNMQILAYWYMDQGYIWDIGEENTIAFHCKGFSTSDICRLKNLLEKEYNLEAFLRKKDSYKVLVISSNSYYKIFNDFVSLILPTMYYKLPVKGKRIYLDENIFKFITNRKV